MIVWAVISLFSLTSIFLYEYFIQGVTIEDIDNEEIPEDIVAPADAAEDGEEQPVEWSNQNQISDTLFMID